jgi:hypothetical protein
MTTDVPEWVHAFNQHILDLDTKVTEIRDSGHDLKEVAEIYVHLQHAKTSIRLIVDTMENILVEKFGDSEEIISNDHGTVQKVIDTPRKAWKNQEVAEAVAERIQRMAVDLDTGEITMTVDQMIAKLLDYVYPSYWRLKPLRDIGINPDEYCEVGEPKPVIKYQKAK